MQSAFDIFQTRQRARKIKVRPYRAQAKANPTMLN
jgi:hypothetical protein